MEGKEGMWILREWWCDDSGGWDSFIGVVEVGVGHLKWNSDNGGGSNGGDSQRGFDKENG